MKKIAQLILVLMISISAFSQVTISPSSLSYSVNGGQSYTTLSTCGNIELASSNSVSIKINVNLTKPHSQVVGTSYLSVYTKRYASDPEWFRTQMGIQESSWIPSSGSTDQCTPPQLLFTLNPAEFNPTGGLLYLVFETSSGVKYQSACSYTITNTPTPKFTLSPTTNSIPCENTSPRTFTVTPANIPAGAAVTYDWSFWGWSGNVSSSMSSVTLTPNSGASLPSTVSVTPRINGTAWPTMYSTVSRAAFSSSATLTGSASVCLGETSVYTVSGVGSGSTVTWISSNTALATVSGATQSQATVNAVAPGNLYITAKITNPCGQVAYKNLTITVGAPVMENGPVYGELWVRKNFGGVTLSFPAVQSASSYNWTITPGPDFPPVCPTTGTVNPAKFSNGLQTMTTTTPSVMGIFGNCLGDYVVTCVAENACGSTDAYIRYVSVGNSGTSPCAVENPGPVEIFGLMQNPVKNGELKLRRQTRFVADELGTEGTPAPSIVQGDEPCFQEWPLPDPNNNGMNGMKVVNPATELDVRLYDFYGNLVFTKTIQEIEEEISVNDVNLNPGKYILHISDGMNLQREIIVVE